MIIGSVVRLSRPFSGNEEYRDELGIVIRMKGSILIPGEVICVVRFIDKEELFTHKHMEIYQHRLDLIEK